MCPGSSAWALQVPRAWLLQAGPDDARVSSFFQGNVLVNRGLPVALVGTGRSWLLSPSFVGLSSEGGELALPASCRVNSITGPTSALG